MLDHYLAAEHDVLIQKKLLSILSNNGAVIDNQK